MEPLGNFEEFFFWWPSSQETPAARIFFSFAHRTNLADRISADCLFSFLACLFSNLCFFIYCPRNRTPAQQAPSGIQSESPHPSAPGQERKPWHSQILPTAHPPWPRTTHGSRHAGGSRISIQRPGEEQMSADLRQAQSTMIHTRTTCSRRPTAPIGRRGKNDSRTRPSFWTVKITAGFLKRGLSVRDYVFL